MILNTPIALKVREIRPLSTTLKHLVLEPADGGLLPAAAAGAHLAVTLGPPDKPLRNSYSIVSAPGERSRYELIVRRVEQSRGGSAFIHEVLRIGGTIHTNGPGNLFPLQSRARKHLLIGGGIGVTPLLSYLAALRARGERLELHQFAAPAETPVFEALLAPFGGHDIHIHAGRSGLDIPALLARQPLGTHAYVCGPHALMETVVQAAAAHGWPASKVHRESFGAAGGAPFTVRLARANREIPVGPQESMLQALENAGVPMSSLCRGGACGECITGVVGGEPEHRDDFLTAQEKASNRLVMPCVSRARGDLLVLDL